VYFLLVFFLITFIKTDLLKLVFLGLAVTLGLYIRLDNALLVACYFIYVIFFFREWLLKKRMAFVFFGAIVLTAVITLIGSPFSGSMSWDSFADWFYWAQNVRVNLFDVELVASPRNEVWAYMEKNFGSANTVLGAFFNNPQIFIRHILKNILIWILNMPLWLTGHFPFTRNWLSDSFMTISALEFSVVCVAGIYIFKKTAVALSDDSIDKMFVTRSFQFLRLLVVAFLIKTTVTSFLLAPMPRYSMEFIVFVVIFAVATLSYRIPFRVSSPTKYIILAICLLIVPTHKDSAYKAYYSNEPDSLYQKAIETIKAIEKNQPIKLLCPTPIDIYLGRVKRSYTAGDFLRPVEDDYSFVDAIVRHDIQGIVIDKKLLMAFKEKEKDNQLLDFAANADKYGFKVMMNSNYQTHWPFVLLLRKELLE
jgi:hypothetical protein